jgi:hypothetical protein
LPAHNELELGALDFKRQQFRQVRTDRNGHTRGLSDLERRLVE